MNSNDFSSETPETIASRHTLSFEKPFPISGCIFCQTSLILKRLIKQQWSHSLAARNPTQRTLCNGAVHISLSSRSSPRLMKATYVFVVIKTVRGPFPVPRVLSQFTGIRTVSWTSNVRNITKCLSGSALVKASTVLSFRRQSDYPMDVTF